jgi:hypothetical protein
MSAFPRDLRTDPWPTAHPQIFTYFKKESIDIESLRKEDLDSLFAFKEKLNRLGHFVTRYKNIEDLKLQFRDQLDTLIEQTHARGFPPVKAGQRLPLRL